MDLPETMKQVLSSKGTTVGPIFVCILLLSLTTHAKSATETVSYLLPGKAINMSLLNVVDSSLLTFKSIAIMGHQNHYRPYFHQLMLNWIWITMTLYYMRELRQILLKPIMTNNQRSIFSFNFLNNRKKKLVNLNPFNQTCIGIETAHRYKLYLNLIRIDFWKVMLMVLGLLLFFLASQFSETPLFYYVTGILLGIFASLLVVVYFLAMLFPKKPMMYSVMAGGWALGIYFTQVLWDNVQLILFNYQTYVFWYIIVIGFISFVICYRWGPPKNEKSKNLIKWGLQLTSIAMIYFSSQFQEASVGIIILAIGIYYFPTKFLRMVIGYWRRIFPPKRRLLTNEEYYEQTARETTKALAELRNFCSSPESNPWRTMMKLKNPQRFASFVEGQSHLLDGEILEYDDDIRLFDNDINSSDISNDEDDDSDNDVNNQPVVRRNGHTNSIRRSIYCFTSTPTSNGATHLKNPPNMIELSEDDED